MIPVSSRAVSAVDYRLRSRELVVSYRGGRTYVYSDVPLSVYEALLAAESIGRFVNFEVKPRYRYRPLRSAMRQAKRNFAPPRRLSKKPPRRLT